MTTQDPIRPFVETLSIGQRAALRHILSVRQPELQAAITSAAATLTKLYVEFNAVNEWVQLLTPWRGG